MWYALQYNIGVLPGNVYVNIILLALMEFPATFLNMFLVNWKYTGRRLTCALTMLAAGIFSFLVVPFIATGRFSK